MPERRAHASRPRLAVNAARKCSRRASVGRPEAQYAQDRQPKDRGHYTEKAPIRKALQSALCPTCCAKWHRARHVRCGRSRRVAIGAVAAGHHDARRRRHRDPLRAGPSQGPSRDHLGHQRDEAEPRRRQRRLCGSMTACDNLLEMGPSANTPLFGTIKN